MLWKVRAQNIQKQEECALFLGCSDYKIWIGENSFFHLKTKEKLNSNYKIRKNRMGIFRKKKKNVAREK